METLFAQGRLLLVAPTGGGKSLSYQLPATILPGTTLVVSPLVALVADQVQALEARGVRATYLAATLEAAEMRRRMARIARRELSLVYVAPERLVFPGFRGLVRELDCPLVAIDEAHCISEWGHDFRPEYLEIGAVLGDLPGARVLACTATATPIVRDEILARLGLPADTPQIVRGFARPNLALRAAEIGGHRERETLVDAALAEALGGPGPARGLLLIGARDLPLRRALLERGAGDATADAAVVEHKWSMFLELIRWAEGGSCRHDAILRYFGDEAETLAGCGRCDVCLALGGDTDARDPEAVTLIVRKALSGVARVHGRFGLQLAVKLIRGEADERLERAGLTTVRTFGNLKEHPASWLVALLRRCVSAGWVSFAGIDRPVVTLTDDGRAVMRGERPARLLLPAESRPKSAGPVEPRREKPAPDRTPARTAANEPGELDAAAVALFEALRRYRLTVARAEGVAPFIVASDRTLRDIAALRPRDLAELERAHGVGPYKAARYGAGLLQVVAKQVGGQLHSG